MGNAPDVLERDAVASTTMTHLCPCCGTELQCPRLRWLPFLGLLLGADDKAARLGGREAKIFQTLWERLMRNEPHPLARVELTRAVCGDLPKWHSVDTDNTISVYICHVRKKIRPFGLDIVSYDRHCALIYSDQRRVTELRRWIRKANSKSPFTLRERHRSANARSMTIAR